LTEKKETQAGKATNGKNENTGVAAAQRKSATTEATTTRRRR